MAGALDIIKERIRQEATQDDKFFRKMLYFFELRLPDDAAFPLTGTFLFPLVINPETYVLEEPFAIQVTPTQGGGLYVEENGIVQRVLRLRGHTGFKPRPMQGSTAVLALTSPEKKSYDRGLLPFVIGSLSGQRHLQYLQDVVFRTYADYKRDPATAEGTMLFFHDPKNDEHWLVAPQSFTLDRSASSPALYRYAIDLLVVDKASAVDADFSEDKSLLDAIKDVLRALKSAFDLINGAISDLTTLLGELKGLVANIATIISTALDVVSRIEEFVNGVTALVRTTVTRVKSLAEEIEDAVAKLEALREKMVADGELEEDEEGSGPGVVPDAVMQALLSLVEGLDRAAMHPAAFETPAQREMRRNKERQELTTSVSPAELDEAAGATPPQTLQEVESMGTALLPGDRSRARAELGVGRDVRAYTGAREVEISQGDTLVTLAAALLGDARLWQDVAVLSGLKPPFIDVQAGTDLGEADESPLPGALGVGQRILVPNFSKAPQALPLLPVMGVAQDEPVEVHLLGSDLAFEPERGDARNQYDLVIDTELGSTDARVVRCRENPAQAIRLRLRTEKGTDTLYKKVGLQRIIALGITPVDLETARFRIVEAVQADPRVASVRRLSFEQPGDDIVEVDTDVEVRGFTQNATIRAVL